MFFLLYTYDGVLYTTIYANLRIEQTKNESRGEQLEPTNKIFYLCFSLSGTHLFDCIYRTTQCVIEYTHQFISFLIRSLASVEIDKNSFHSFFLYKMKLFLKLLMIMPIIVDSSSLLPPVSNATLIAHPSSGIFIQYVGEYIPSDFITNISIIIPLTATYCNIVPLIMAQNIPHCAYLFNSTAQIRYTRQIGEGWIAMGIAGTAVAIATSNRIAITSVENKLDNLAVQVARSQNNANVNTVRIAHLHDGTMKIGNELRDTQKLLFENEENDRQQNSSIFAINSSFSVLSQYIDNLEHKIRNIFLSQAINDIYKGRNTLSMIDPNDMPLIISQIFNDIDETSRKLFDHMSVNEIIRNLLIAQHLTFVLPTVYQTNNTQEIGRLIFTNFFGIPRPNISYSIYEVKTVPYFVRNSFIRVTELPVFIGQCIADGTFLEFYAEDAKMCLFSNWTTCKDQPPILKSLVNPCLSMLTFLIKRKGPQKYFHC
jgi:hypothetical protein